jgi:hypothetical protein
MPNSECKSRALKKRYTNGCSALSLDFDRSEAVQSIVSAKSFEWRTATMTFASRLARANDNAEQLDSAGHALNKLAQTFVAQMEALNRYGQALEVFPQSYHEPYYLSYLDEDFAALAAKYGMVHVRDVNAFVSKVMVFNKRS